jgi:hypothetical protein
MSEDTPDVPEESPSWSSYYKNSFDYFTGDGNLDKAADGPLIDIIPTALKDIISEEGTDTVSPSPIGLQWTIKTAVPVNGIEIDDASLESLLEDNLTAGATEISVDADALSGIDGDIESGSYVVLSEGDEDVQVAVPVITSEDESGTSTKHITRLTLAVIIGAGVLILVGILRKMFKKKKPKRSPYPYPYPYPYTPPYP